MRCSVVLILVALASCASLGRAQLQIDESAFFDAFKAKHPVAWSEGSAGGAGIAVILEEILGAKLDSRSEKDCNVAFAAIAGRWSGGDMPPAIFAQMLRNSKPELQRVLSATRTSMAGGLIPPAAEHTGAAAEAATAGPGGLAGQLSVQSAARGGLAGKLSAQPQTAAKLTSDAGAPGDNENIKISTPKPHKGAADVEVAALAVAELAAAEADMAAAEAELAAAESELVRAELDAMKTSALRKRAVTAGVTPEQIDLADDAEDTKAVLVQLVLAQEGRTTQNAHPPPPPPPLPPPPPYAPPPPTQREQPIEQRRKPTGAEEANAPTDPVG
jgi:hypothetical protein